MAKTEMLCTFNRRLCTECPLYRGRHYYLCFNEKYRGYIGRSKRKAKPGIAQRSVDLRTLGKLTEPWAGRRLKAEPKINLKVIDMETGNVRVCPLAEAKRWDWSNPEIMRVVGGFQVTSWDKLVEIASYKAERGYQEVELYEAPRFMLLGGG